MKFLLFLPSSSTAKRERLSEREREAGPPARTGEDEEDERADLSRGKAGRDEDGEGAEQEESGFTPGCEAAGGGASPPQRSFSGSSSGSLREAGRPAHHRGERGCPEQEGRGSVGPGPRAEPERSKW